MQVVHKNSIARVSEAFVATLPIASRCSKECSLSFVDEQSTLVVSLRHLTTDS